MEKNVGLLRLGGIKVKIVRGDVTEQSADCIVVPEFCNCACYTGIGNSCVRLGMRAGMKAYDQYVTSRPFNFGDAFLTYGGRDHILLGHVATIGVKQDEQFATVYKAMYNIIRDCNQIPYVSCKSIAVPELGMGMTGHLTQEQSARAIIGAVDAFSRVCGATIVEEVILCVYHESTEPAEKVLAEGSYRDFKPEVGQKPFDPVAWIHGMGVDFCKD